MYSRASFTRRFSAAHRVAGDPGVCHRIHGHNYLAEIDIDAAAKGDNGFILPADTVKDVVDRQYDHKLILQDTDSIKVIFEHDGWDAYNAEIEDEWIVRVPFVPSTENLAFCIAADILQECVEYLPDNCPVRVYVKLTETPTISAVAEVTAP